MNRDSIWPIVGILCFCGLMLLSLGWKPQERVPGTQKPRLWLIADNDVVRVYGYRAADRDCIVIYSENQRTGDPSPAVAVSCKQ